MTDINVEVVQEHEDGSATMAFDFDEETTQILLKHGLEVLFAKEGVKDLAVCDPIEPLTKEQKTYKLSDTEFQTLLHLGVIEAITAGMKLAEAKESNC